MTLLLNSSGLFLFQTPDTECVLQMNHSASQLTQQAASPSIITLQQTQCAVQAEGLKPYCIRIKLIRQHATPDQQPTTKKIQTRGGGLDCDDSDPRDGRSIMKRRGSPLRDRTGETRSQSTCVNTYGGGRKTFLTKKESRQAVAKLISSVGRVYTRSAFF